MTELSYKERLIRDYLGWDWTPDEIAKREEALIKSLVERQDFTREEAVAFVKNGDLTLRRERRKRMNPH